MELWHSGIEPYYLTFCCKANLNTIMFSFDDLPVTQQKHELVIFTILSLFPSSWFRDTRSVRALATLQRPGWAPSL